MKPSYWDKSSVSERRREIRLEGKCLEGLECAILSSESQEGWDQPTRAASQIGNLSAGGLEVQAAASFPFSVDAKVSVEMRFAGETDWLSLPAIVRHVHFAESGCLVGMQFLWQECRESDAEYRLCDQLLRLERRRV